MSIFSEISPGVVLPVPEDYFANDLVAMLFTIWGGGFAFVLIPWVLRSWIKDGDKTLMWMWLGGLICSVIEPMLDHLGHLWYPTNLPGPAFIGFDLHIPYLIPPCYVAFISMTGYWAYTKMRDGLDLKGLFMVWLIIASTDLALEIPGTATGAYTYYGDVPFKILGFPMAWSWLNGTSMLMVGFLLWLVKPHLKGNSSAFIMLVPVIAMGASYGMTAWPYFMALNWEMPVYMTYLLTVLSLLLCLLVVRFVGAVVSSQSDNTVEALGVNTKKRPVTA
ncbi:hypothetical protein [Alteromonas sp. M12]|uniref:hypothetical protein n=1 Tax=Alteromonas sp. M12 TaxID=3135644 RepID=UPI00319E09DB